MKWLNKLICRLFGHNWRSSSHSTICIRCRVNFSFRDTKIGLISSNHEATLGLIRLDLEADTRIKKDPIIFHDTAIYITSMSDARLGEDSFADMRDKKEVE